MKIRRSLSVVVMVLAALAGRVPSGALAAPDAICTAVAGTVYWHIDSSWSCGGTVRQPTATDDVNVPSGTLMLVTTDGARADNLTVGGNISMGNNLTLLVNHDLTIPSGGTFQGGGVGSTVQMNNGNLILQPGGTLTPGNARWLFLGYSGVQTVSGNPTFYDLTVNTGATLDLGTGNLTVNGTVINYGIIRATRNIDATGTQSFGLAGGPVNAANVSLNVTTDNFTSITLDRYDTQHAHFTGSSEASGVGYARYWAITPVGTGTVDLTLPANFTTGVNSKVCRYVAGAGYGWDCAVDAYTANTVTRNGVTSFSDWAVGNAGPTAVTLNNLEAQAAPGNLSAGWLLVLLGVLVISGWLWPRRLARG